MHLQWYLSPFLLVCALAVSSPVPQNNLDEAFPDHLEEDPVQIFTRTLPPKKRKNYYVSPEMAGDSRSRSRSRPPPPGPSGNRGRSPPSPPTGSYSSYGTGSGVNPSDMYTSDLEGISVSSGSGYNAGEQGAAYSGGSHNYNGSNHASVSSHGNAAQQQWPARHTGRRRSPSPVNSYVESSGGQKIRRNGSLSPPRRDGSFSPQASGNGKNKGKWPWKG